MQNYSKAKVAWFDLMLWPQSNFEEHDRFQNQYLKQSIIELEIIIHHSLCFLLKVNYYINKLVMYLLFIQLDLFYISLTIQYYY